MGAESAWAGEITTARTSLAVLIRHASECCRRAG